MLSNEANYLNGKRIMIVEDEFLIALDMVHALEALGATVLGPAPTPFYAMQLMGAGERRKLHAAVLDVHLHRDTVFEVADLLKERSIPFVFATGFGAEGIPTRFSDIRVLSKPVHAEELSACLMAMVYRPAAIPVSRPLPPILEQAEPPATIFARVIARTLGLTDPLASVNPEVQADTVPGDLVDMFQTPPSDTCPQVPRL